MTIAEFILKIKKRINYFFAGEKSVETYFFKVIESNNQFTKFSYQGREFKARLQGTSDYDVLRQVIVQEEYKIPMSYLINGEFEKKIIIDAGANIGATSAYFKNRFPETKIICIEPDSSNFSLLEKNLEFYKKNGSVKYYKAGLTGQSNQNLKVHSDFGDGRDWAKSVEVVDEFSILKSITLEEIIEENNIAIIDFLKIDIEGGEIFLLDDKTNLDFLKITRCIALEIHDELGIRKDLNKLLISNGFILVVDGQTTIGFNRKL